MSTKFGWCLPGIEQHELCIVKIEWNGGVLCDCTCHGVESAPETEDVVDS